MHSFAPKSQHYLPNTATTVIFIMAHTHVLTMSSEQVTTPPVRRIWKYISKENKILSTDFGHESGSQSCWVVNEMLAGEPEL